MNNDDNPQSFRRHTRYDGSIYYADPNPSQNAASYSGTHPVGELTPVKEGAADNAPPAIQAVTAQALLDQAASDHERGCMGRQYSCTCGYDAATEALLIAAAGEIDGLREANHHYRDSASPSNARAVERNWAEDSSHENGNYECLCCECGQPFIGHKRRVICKACSSLLSPPQQGDGKPADGAREALAARVTDLEVALKPFADCIYNDNCDITVDTSNLKPADYLIAYTVMRPRARVSPAVDAQRCGVQSEPVAWRTLNEFGYWYATTDRAMADTWINIEKFEVEPLYLASPTLSSADRGRE